MFSLHCSLLHCLLTHNHSYFSWHGHRTIYFQQCDISYSISLDSIAYFHFKKYSLIISHTTVKIQAIQKYKEWKVKLLFYLLCPCSSFSSPQVSTTTGQKSFSHTDTGMILYSAYIKNACIDIQLLYVQNKYVYIFHIRGKNLLF